MAGYPSIHPSHPCLSIQGSFESNHRTGKGRLVTVAGLTYQGSFKRDHFEGHGTMSYGDEGLYEGQWHESRRHGQGRYTDQSTGEKRVGVRTGQA